MRKAETGSRLHRGLGFTIQVGSNEITKIGARRFDWHDAYHVIMSLTWPRFFAFAVGVYLLVNLVFATIYWLGDQAIANAHSFLDHLFFSVETLATVGYGNMAPATIYGHFVATAEIITGMLSIAVMTSLVFARFSKPTARVLFSRVVVITPYHGVPTLMFRVANQRHSYILEATATVALLRDEQTAEGHQLRRFYDLKLERRSTPLFALSWQIMHRIDETSPLHGVTAEDLRSGDMRLAVTITGLDETFAATVTSRYDYPHENIVFGGRFADIFEEGDHPRHLYIDLSKFHDVVPTAADR